MNQNSSSNDAPLFEKALYMKCLAVTLGLTVLGLFASYLYYATITVTDTVGSVICAIIVAYMAHLYIMMRRREQ